MSERIGRSLLQTGFSPTHLERWFGDDAAVLEAPQKGRDLLICTDAAVAGVHLDLDLCDPEDLGWRACVASLSDIAAMGGDPWRMVVSVSTTGSVAVADVMQGALDASVAFDCPIVGGDTTGSATVSVVATVLGTVPKRAAVGRDGASPGDAVLVTGPLGASAAGLRSLRSGSSGRGALARAYRHPVPHLAEGVAARECGASAMIDVSDGLSLDCARLAAASNVGLELDAVPVAPGARRLDALGGGEDYELVIATPDPEALLRCFADRGLREPQVIGRLTDRPGQYTLGGEPLDIMGFEHDVE